MKPEKPCKGSGKAKGYGCGVLVPVQLYNSANRKYGLGISCGCFSKWCRETEEGKALEKKHTLKATKPRRELQAAKVQDKDRKKLGRKIQDTQDLFNKYIRLRDKGKPCISEGIPYKSDFEAGHCFPVSTYAGLRFDFDNCHGQSVLGNRHKDGNQSDYLTNLPGRIGEERTKALIKRAQDYKRNGHRFTREFLDDLQKDLKQRIKQLQNGIR